MITQENIPYTADEIKAMVKTIEELRRKYNKALERARALNDGKDVDIEAGTTTCEYIFPELKESEDEKIKRELRNDLLLYVPTPERYIAWLEKQGGQKIDNSNTMFNACINALRNVGHSHLADWLEKQTKSDKVENAALPDVLVDERIRDSIALVLTDVDESLLFNRGVTLRAALAWLEKQKPIDEDEFAKAVVRGYATEFINYLDATNVRLSLLECEDIENAFMNADWAKLHRYHDKFIKEKDINSEGDEQKSKFKAGDADGEDEKIRKEIVDFITSSNKYGTNEKCEAWLNWFEKQGEQPTDKVEPKFKIGDWIIPRTLDVINPVYCITSITEDRYIVAGQYGNISNIPFEIEELWRLWSINDAKDGDVLACESGWTCIFKTLVNNEAFSSYCFMDSTKWFCETGSEYHTLKEELNGKIYPATKEKRDLFFEKMKEAGYEWDEEKKELSKQPLKITPKFKEGDYIVPDNITPLEIWRVINIDEDGYYNIQPITNIINTEDDEIYRVPAFTLEKDYYNLDNLKKKN